VPPTLLARADESNAGEGLVTMKLPHRRRFLQLAAGAAALPAVLPVAWAQAYPSRPVRWIVAFAAGGPTDIVARIMGQYLSERLGQQFIIDNRPGAGGIVGTQAAINSPADGYTILMAAHVHAINATLYQRLPYNFLNDIAPIAGLVRMPNVMEVTPSFPAKTVGEFIAYVTANPGKVSYASAGNGTSAHLAAELFRAMTGVDFVHVPYRGSGPALTDLLNGQVQVMFDTISSSIAHIQAGKLRALAVTSVTDRICCPTCRRLPRRCRVTNSALGSARAPRPGRRPKSFRS
jgi:tripartite-type tricarboxylate transporter receptor subunit TctC